MSVSLAQEREKSIQACAKFILECNLKEVLILQSELARQGVEATFQTAIIEVINGQEVSGDAGTQ